MNEKTSIDIIMLSTLDKNAGGRETWLYNFLPELLKDKRIARVNLFGFKTPEDLDHKEEILTLDSCSEGKKTLFPNILEGRETRFPKAFQMFKRLKKGKNTNHSTNYALAMGIFELLMINRIAKYKKAKKIVWLRSIFSHEKAHAIPKKVRGLFLKYEINQLRKVDVIISNGDDIRDFYEQFGLKVNVIKNGVNVHKWAMSQVQLLNPIKVAYIGRLSKVKGIEDFFSLAETVKNSKYADNFEFHIVGDNYVYADKVKELENQNIVKNHNVIPNSDLPAFLNTIDVCVALTYASAEGGGGGTSNAMLEQMASGRIMLAWDNVIFRQYLNERNAFLAKQFSVSELQEQLLKILSNNEKALNKAEQGKRTIQPYTYEANVNKFKELL